MTRRSAPRGVLESHGLDGGAQPHQHDFVVVLCVGELLLQPSPLDICQCLPAGVHLLVLARRGASRCDAQWRSAVHLDLVAVATLGQPPHGRLVGLLLVCDEPLRGGRGGLRVRELLAGGFQRALNLLAVLHAAPLRPSVRVLRRVELRAQLADLVLLRAPDALPWANPCEIWGPSALAHVHRAEGHLDDLGDGRVGRGPHHPPPGAPDLVDNLGQPAPRQSGREAACAAQARVIHLASGGAMQMLDGRVAPVAPRRAPLREGVEECGRWRRGRRGDLARGVLQEGRRAGPGPKRGEGGWKLEVLGARGFLCARHPLLVAEGQLPPGAVAPPVAHAGRPAGRACPDTAGSGFGLVHVLRPGFGGGTGFPTPKFSSPHGRCVN